MDANERPFGFDAIRLVLPVVIILWHTIVTCYGRGAETWFWCGPLRPILYFILPSFFALSGFLVAGSLERNDKLSFFSLRALRIAPALTAEVIISALLLGPILTELPLSSYFTDEKFFAYFYNTIGYIHFTLPGVFTNLPLKDFVNAQLWTVPYELECYLLIGGLAILGLTRQANLLLASFVVLTIGILTIEYHQHSLPIMDQIPPGRMLVLCFLAGVYLFNNKKRVQNSGLLAILSILTYSLFIWHPVGIYLAALPIAYLTVWIGLKQSNANIIRQLSNYSYGLYLYGFPIQQATNQVLVDHREWYINFVISLPISFCFAFLSWHYLEKPIISYKRDIRTIMSRISKKIRLYRLTCTRRIAAMINRQPNLPRA